MGWELLNSGLALGWGLLHGVWFGGGIIAYHMLTPVAPAWAGLGRVFPVVVASGAGDLVSGCLGGVGWNFVGVGWEGGVDGE